MEWHNCRHRMSRKENHDFRNYTLIKCLADTNDHSVCVCTTSSSLSGSTAFFSFFFLFSSSFFFLSLSGKRSSSHAKSCWENIRSSSFRTTIRPRIYTKWKDNYQQMKLFASAFMFSDFKRFQHHKMQEYFSQTHLSDSVQ